MHSHRARRAQVMSGIGALLERRATALARARRREDVEAMREAALDVVDMARLLILAAGGEA